MSPTRNGAALFPSKSDGQLCRALNDGDNCDLLPIEASLFLHQKSTIEPLYNRYGLD